MTAEEFSNQFDVLYNNITSNQAPGLNEYEKSVFLTKAQNEIVKNYFTANSKGNNIGQGFDDSAKRQADFSCLMKTSTVSNSASGDKIDGRSTLYTIPTDIFIIINEKIGTSTNSVNINQVLPLRYDEYTRLMSKPFKRPLKNQVWRLFNKSTSSGRVVELIPPPGVTITGYTIRYIKFPNPIIVGNLDGLSIENHHLENTTGPTGSTAIAGGCELDPIIHEDILQRAVELAKVAWTATGQDNAQMVLQAGQRSE